VSRHGIGALVIDHTSQVAVNSILLMLKHKGAGPEDMLELRMMLECQAASFSAQRATDDDIASIAKFIDAMRIQPRSTAENVRLDCDFHLAVADASHNLVLVTLVNAVGDLLYDTISATHAVSTDIAVRVDAHSKVLDAIKRRDPEAAVAAMTEHLKKTEILMQLVGAQAPRGSGEEVTPSRPRFETLADSRRTRSDQETEIRP